MKTTRWNLAVFLLPSLLIVCVGVLFPAFMSFMMCLYSWDGITSPQWVGISNFRNILLCDDMFWKALSNNIFIISVPTVSIISLALFFAYLLNRCVKGREFFQAAFLFPNMINIVAVALMWIFIYNPYGGLLNEIFGGAAAFFGEGSLVGQEFARLKAFPWLAPANLYIAIVPIMVWASTGFYIILFLAGMDRIPVSMYEAAEIDGAGRFETFWHITLPMLWDVIAAGIIFLAVAGMKMFDLVWIFSNQWVSSDNHVIGTLLVQRAFKELKFGEGATIAVILFCVVMGAITIFKRYSDRNFLE